MLNIIIYQIPHWKVAGYQAMLLKISLFQTPTKKHFWENS